MNQRIQYQIELKRHAIIYEEHLLGCEFHTCTITILISLDLCYAINALTCWRNTYKKNS